MLNESDVTKTAAIDQSLREKRSQLIIHDLGYHNPTSKKKTKKNDDFIHDLTYKPFNIRELDIGDYEYEDFYIDPASE